RTDAAVAYAHLERRAVVVDPSRPQASAVEVRRDVLRLHGEHAAVYVDADVIRAGVAVFGIVERVELDADARRDAVVSHVAAGPAERVDSRALDDEHQTVRTRARAVESQRPVFAAAIRHPELERRAEPSDVQRRRRKRVAVLEISSG